MDTSKITFKELMGIDIKSFLDSELWNIMLNVFPDHAPKEVQLWYSKITEEFYNRPIKLTPIMK